jgi:hypothetical protein
MTTESGSNTAEVKGKATAARTLLRQRTGRSGGGSHITSPKGKAMPTAPAHHLAEG